MIGSIEKLSYNSDVVGGGDKSLNMTIAPFNLHSISCRKIVATDTQNFPLVVLKHSLNRPFIVKFCG